MKTRSIVWDAKGLTKTYANQQPELSGMTSNGSSTHRPPRTGGTRMGRPIIRRESPVTLLYESKTYI